MSSSAPTTEANTENTSYSTTTIGQLGLTGQNAVDALRGIAESQTVTLGHLQSVSGDTIRGIATEGFRALSSLSSQNATTQQSIVASAGQTLSGLVNATQDFSQRAIAAGTGQRTDIQQLGKAADGNQTTTFLILGIVVVAFLMGGNG